VSSEVGTRFDQNITGFRGEEEFGFSATPYVATGKFVKILGLWFLGASRVPPAGAFPIYAGYRNAAATELRNRRSPAPRTKR
jgi:hypothetical protein